MYMYVYCNQLSQQMTNSFIFYLSENIFLTSLPLKDSFTGLKSSLEFFLIFQSSAQFLLTSIFLLISLLSVLLLLLLQFILVFRFQ